MKIFGWMHNKLHARFGCNNLNSISVNPAITEEIHPIQEFSDWAHGLLAIGTFGNTKDTAVKEQEHEQQEEEFTVEEVENIQKEINLILEDDRKNHLVIGGGGKAINNVNNSKSINKKSFSFLVKKMFVCRAGFTPTLNIRDQVPESRMEKILRAILHKKIHPQNPNSTNSPTKKVILQKKPSSSFSVTNHQDDKGSKWVKTDSEYIVLEI